MDVGSGADVEVGFIAGCRVGVGVAISSVVGVGRAVDTLSLGSCIG